MYCKGTFFLSPYFPIHFQCIIPLLQKLPPMYSTLFCTSHMHFTCVKSCGVINLSSECQTVLSSGWGIDVSSSRCLFLLPSSFPFLSSFFLSKLMFFPQCTWQITFLGCIKYRLCLPGSSLLCSRWTTCRYVVVLCRSCFLIFLCLTRKTLGFYCKTLDEKKIRNLLW